jgi:N-acetylmuramoyl-L-alanine amidase
VAQRENSSAGKSIASLRDLIQTISLNDKITESGTFARAVQASIFNQAARSGAAGHDRGTKRAPFIVLIGASMPSALTEIGFLSNTNDEYNLGQSEYRQKIAEALCEGIWNYSKSLSRFELTRRVETSGEPSAVGSISRLKN